MSEQEAVGKTNRSVLGTLTFSHLAQHFYSGAPILYQSIREELALSYTEIGLMVGISNILGGFLQMVYSVAGRRFSRRILLGGSNILMSLGCFMTGMADRFVGVLGGNVTAGVGQAGQHPVGTSIIAEKYGKSGVGWALSLFYGLGYVGNILSPLMLSGVAVLAGWRASFFVLAAIPLMTGITVLVRLRGEQAGEKALPKTTQSNLFDDIKSSLRIRGAIAVLVAQSFIAGGMGMGVVTTWVPVFLRDSVKGLGLTVFDAGVVTAVSTAGGVIGTIIIGRLADRYGYLKTAMLNLLSTIVTVYLLSAYSSFSLILIPHLFVISMSTFSISTLLQAHLTSIATASQRDVLLGLYFTFGFGISSLWNTIMGNIIDAYSFGAIWVVMSVLGVIALTALLAAYRTPRSNQMNADV